jgi:hypothetical protein
VSASLQPRVTHPRHQRIDVRHRRDSGGHDPFLSSERSVLRVRSRFCDFKVLRPRRRRNRCTIWSSKLVLVSAAAFRCGALRTGRCARALGQAVERHSRTRLRPPLRPRLRASPLAACRTASLWSISRGWCTSARTATRAPRSARRRTRRGQSVPHKARTTRKTTWRAVARHPSGRRPSLVKSGSLRWGRWTACPCWRSPRPITPTRSSLR